MTPEIVNISSFPNYSNPSSGFNIYTIPFTGLYRISVCAEQVSGTFVLQLNFSWVDDLGNLQLIPGILDTSTNNPSFFVIMAKMTVGQNTNFGLSFTSGSGVANAYAVVEKMS